MLGLLPDAQPCSLDLDAVDAQRPVARRRRGASALHRLRQCAGARDRTFVPGALRLGRHGRGPSLDHLLAAARYLAFNPVKARLAATPKLWRWSSVHAHLRGEDDALVRVAPLPERIARFDELLELAPNEDEARVFEQPSAVGRPLGSPEFIDKAEAILGRAIKPKRRGRKPKAVDGNG